MLNKPFYKWTIGIILILIIILLLNQVRFIFNPVVTMVSILIVPITISAFLYYLLRPIVSYLESKKMNRMLSILLIYLLFAGIMTLFFIIVWPPLQKQITDFINNVPKLISGLEHQMNELQKNRYLSIVNNDNSKFKETITGHVNTAIEAATGYMTHVFTFLNDFIIVVGTVPILLYYMLKEDKKVKPSILRLLPGRYRKEGNEVFYDLDNMLKGFIAGRMISAIVLAIMSFIGFWSIGLPYPLLLAIVGALFNFIPYFGSLLGAIPCVIVAFTVSPSMVLWVIIIVVVAQQIEGNLISPYIYGKTISIHPLTTIVLLLVAGDFAGILGMILAIPVYMMIKIIVVRIYQLFFARKYEEMTQ